MTDLTSRSFDTPYGTFRVYLTGKDEGNIESVGPIVVNRIEHKVSGQFRVGQSYGRLGREEVAKPYVYVSGYPGIRRTDHPDYYDESRPTDNARRKIDEAIQQPILAFVTEAGDAAIRQELRSAINSCEYKAKSKREQAQRLLDEATLLDNHVFDLQDLIYDSERGENVDEDAGRLIAKANDLRY